MEIHELLIGNYKDVIRSYAQRQDGKVALFAIVPKTMVLRGKGEIDAKYCQEHDIDIYNSLDFGGGIVSFEGDLIVIIMEQDGWDVGERLIDVVRQELLSSGLNAQYSDNDILIDDIYKVASYSSVNVGNRYIYTGLQVTFNADAEVIRHICLKDSVKIPRGLSYYNINKQRMLDRLLAFCRDN